MEEWSKENFDPDNNSNCYRCGLLHTCITPKMNYTGRGEKKCLIIAEAPGENEDRLGTQLIGRAGEFLRSKLKSIGLDLDRDFWKINAVNCYPGKSETPTDDHIKYCRPFVNNIIEKLQPEKIWLLGNVSLESFLGEDFKDTSISRFRGLTIPDRKTNSIVNVLFHPSFIMRNENDENLLSCFIHDLKEASLNLREKIKPEPKTDNVIFELYQFNEIINALKEILNVNSPLFIDFETSGLRPYRSGHFIASVSLANLQGNVYSFPINYRNYFSEAETKEIKLYLKNIMESKRLVAHNLKFEHNWARCILGVEKLDWEWDTMIGARCIDNRQKFCDLKFQTYLNFGVRPYNKEVEDFLEGAEFNSVDKIPLDKLLRYNALDTFYSRELYKLHSKYQDADWASATDLFIEGQIALADCEYNGICVDEEYFNKADIELSIRIENLKNELNDSVEAKKFFEIKHKKIDWGASKDLGFLFYEIVGAGKRYTEKGNLSLDKNSIEKIASKFPTGNKLLELRRLEKTKGTYLAQFKREVCNGKIHPCFDLVNPKSYRSSSSKPNFQNIPVREEEAKKIVRSGIIPTPGNQILEADYSGIEVRISVCYHKDPNMIKYIKDPTTDMHRDVCCDLFMIKPEEITKEIRFYGKNGWTFPQFYGSYWKECGTNIWMAVLNLKFKSGSTVKDHLKTKGITSLELFLEHCKKCERIFWGERFCVYDMWKENINSLYRRTGRIKTFFGFEFTGYMKYNDVTNYPIQGTAFHCLLWTLIHVNKKITKRNYKSKIVGQIHDSIVIDLFPPEKDEIIEIIKYMGTDQLIKKNPWIIVPLEIEFEITDINEGWYGKK